MNRDGIGRDGAIPYERHKGRLCQGELCEPFEVVHWLVLASKEHKFDYRTLVELWQGTPSRDHSQMISDDDVIQGRTVCVSPRGDGGRLDGLCDWMHCRDSCDHHVSKSDWPSEDDTSRGTTSGSMVELLGARRAQSTQQALHLTLPERGCRCSSSRGDSRSQHDAGPAGEFQQRSCPFGGVLCSS